MPAYARSRSALRLIHGRAVESRPLARASDCVTPDLEAAAAALLEHRRGRSHRPPPPRAGNLAANILRPLLPKDGATLSELQRAWADIVGAKLAGMTAPEKLTRGAAGAVLTIRVHAAAAPFVQHQAPLIMERCNLAGAGLKSIQIRHGALPRPAAGVRPVSPETVNAFDEDALRIGLDAIADPNLRAALMRLGRAVKTR